MEKRCARRLVRANVLLTAGRVLLALRGLREGVACVEQALDEYQQALEQAVSEAIAEIRPQLTQLDEDSKQIMVDSGMELIEYDDSFFQEILALDSVTALYDQINEDVNGLGTILQEALAEAAAEQAE